MRREWFLGLPRSALGHPLRRVYRVGRPSGVAAKSPTRGPARSLSAAGWVGWGWLGRAGPRHSDCGGCARQAGAKDIFILPPPPGARRAPSQPRTAVLRILPCAGRWAPPPHPASPAARPPAARPPAWPHLSRERHRFPPQMQTGVFPGRVELGFHLLSAANVRAGSDLRDHLLQRF